MHIGAKASLCSCAYFLEQAHLMQLLAVVLSVIVYDTIIRFERFCVLVVYRRLSIYVGSSGAIMQCRVLPVLSQLLRI